MRIKAFKAIFSLAENPSMDLKEMLAQLECSCESTRDLYLFMLSLVGPLTDEAAARIAAARSKFNPTEEEKNPNMKFAENALAPILAGDPDFDKIIKKRKMSWDQYDVFLRHLYDSLRQTEEYSRYMENPQRSLKEDVELFVSIYTKLLPDNPELEDILEDLSIWWNDDLEYSLSHCLKTFDELALGRSWSLPALFNPGDRDYIRGIVTQAHAAFDKYFQQIADITPKWDKNRICTADLALIVAGLSESAANPGMDIRIIISEYVEISKFYSTRESRGFVNGVLDNLLNKNKNN